LLGFSFTIVGSGTILEREASVEEIEFGAFKILDELSVGLGLL